MLRRLRARPATAGRRRSRPPASPPTLDDLLDDDTLDAIVLATPVPTHGPLAERVLDAGKHCFVEKPLAYTVEDAERAVAAAERSGRILMVGHLLVYHPGVDKLKEIADSGELGDIHYIYSHRLNLGKLRSDENALWSLGAHDISVVLHLAGEDPDEVEARGEPTPARASRTSCSRSCASRPASPRTCTCPGWTRTRARASRSWAPRRWRRSTTWSSSARSPSTTRASTRTPTPTASTSPARATSTARGSPTASRCGSSASTSSSASARAHAALRRRGGPAGRARAGGAAGESGRDAAVALAALMSDPRITSGDPLAGYTSPPPPGAGGVAAADPFSTPVAGQLAALRLVAAGRRAPARRRRDRDHRRLFFGIFAAFAGVGFLVGDTTGYIAIVLGIFGFGLCVFVAALLYAPLMMARTNGKTLGRMASGIRVVRANGQPIDFGYAVLREVVVKWLLFGAIRLLHVRPRGADRLPVAAWDEENRALHDLVVNSRDRFLDLGLALTAASGPRGSLRPASVQMTWSRPGPTPISAIGTPMKSEMYCR